MSDLGVSSSDPTNTQYIAFQSLCVSAATTKPVIYVNHATAYFNISGTVSFENIKFTGINALAVPSSSALQLLKWPVQFCYVTTEPNGYEVSFKLAKKSTTSSSSFSYSCIDSWYSAPQRPDMTIPDRRCQMNNFQKFSSS